MRIQLHVRTPKGGLRNFEHGGPLVRMGRDPAWDLTFTEVNDNVSWHHAIIELTTGGAYLADVGSTNGTFVKRDSDTTSENDFGPRIGEPTRINVDNVIRLGVAGPTITAVAIDLVDKTITTKPASAAKLARRIESPSTLRSAARLADSETPAETTRTDPRSSGPLTTREIVLGLEKTQRAKSRWLIAAGACAALLLAWFVFTHEKKLTDVAGQTRVLTANTSALSTQQNSLAAVTSTLGQKTDTLTRRTDAVEERTAKLILDVGKLDDETKQLLKASEKMSKEVTEFTTQIDKLQRSFLSASNVPKPEGGGTAAGSLDKPQPARSAQETALERVTPRFGGINQRTPLDRALQLLSKECSLVCRLDVAAFAKQGRHNIGKAEVGLEPVYGEKGRDILEKVLAQVRAKYVLERDGLLIVPLRHDISFSTAQQALMLMDNGRTYFGILRTVEMDRFYFQAQAQLAHLPHKEPETGNVRFVTQVLPLLQVSYQWYATSMAKALQTNEGLYLYNPQSKLLETYIKLCDHYANSVTKLNEFERDNKAAAAMHAYQFAEIYFTEASAFFGGIAAGGHDHPLRIAVYPKGSLPDRLSAHDIASVRTVRGTHRYDRSSDALVFSSQEVRYNEQANQLKDWGAMLYNHFSSEKGKRPGYDWGRKMCPRCERSGTIVTDFGTVPCSKCRGDGEVWGIVQKSKTSAGQGGFADN